MKIFKESDYLALPSNFSTPQIDPNQVKPASLNLLIGDIFLPGTEKSVLGGVDNPHQRFSLVQGATVVLKTSQLVRMSPKHVGIMFPPNQVSLQGLLMTNPGHVDPGYQGFLHVTVINMGNKPYELKSGQEIIRLMIFELDADVISPLGAKKSPINEELLATLSHDFFDLTDRIRKEVDKQERHTKLLTVTMPIITALIGLIASTYWLYSQFGERMAKIEGASTVTTISNQLNQTHFDLERISNRLSELEKIKPSKKE